MDEPITCKTHNVPKVPMRNKRNAPMLGCPVCHGKAPATSPEPNPQAEPAPAPARESRGWRGGILSLAGGE